MPAKNEDLHGNAPDDADVALLIIDMINDFEFPDGEALYAQSLPAAKRIAELKRRAAQSKIPIIYINDNFGKWRSDFQQQVHHCLHDAVRGQSIARLLKPGDEDYFVLKAKHSAFYATPLDLLLIYLKVKTLIITGIAGDVCVLFTANDAYMRDYHLVVPSDCIASRASEDNERSLLQMRETLKADTTPSAELDFDALKRKSEARQEGAKQEGEQKEGQDEGVA